MKYKMLVLDVDGTLLNDEKEISKRTLNTLLKVQQMGVRIMLASGRPTYGLLPLAKKLELGTYNGYILSYNGGQVINASNGEVVFERRINPEHITYLEKKAEKNGFSILTYNGDTVVTNNPNDPHVQAEAALNGMKVEHQEFFSAAIDYPPCKCMLVSDDEEALVGLENHWKRRLNGVLDVFRSEPYFIEITVNGVDKAESIARLLEHIDMKREQCICCGDGFNDKTMVEYAGVGVAMGNAQQVVKDVADYVTASCDEDGLVEVIKKFVL